MNCPAPVRAFFTNDIIPHLSLQIVLKVGLASPDCFDKLVLQRQFTHAACIKSSLSKSLGVGIVAGSSLVKLPQVFKLFASGSGDGISLTGVMLELTALTMATAYNFSQGFPFRKEET
jgi:mannose-P-dolichol utilization defect protein 1